MREVKGLIASNLFAALHEANLSDCADENDLSPHGSRQGDLYGHLGKALEALGYSEALEDYYATGVVPKLD